MKGIVEYLREASNSDGFKEVFKNGKQKLTEKILIEDLPIIEKVQDLFERDKLYKISASKKYAKKISLEEAYWIIKKWGGIKSFKESLQNDAKISGFIDKLKSNRVENLTESEFSTISSLSKLAFFFDTEEFAIYDSRVIYSLNWAIFKTGEPTIKYFPMPTGRNNIIVNYPMEAVIKFSLLQHGVTEFDVHYFSKDEAYFQYINLINKFSKALYCDDAKPFYAEMLLFGMADKYVFEDMKRSLRLSIKE